MHALPQAVDSLRAMLLEIVNPAEWMPRIGPLMQAHWAESGFSGGAFSPDLEFYRAAFDAGKLFAVAATFGGVLVGYCTVLVNKHHHAGVLVASSDAIYVLPEFRGHHVGGRIVHAAEKKAKGMGATCFMWHCPTGSGFGDALIKRGARAVETVVVKEI